MRERCRQVVEARWFEPFMIGLILFNAVLIGLETSHSVVERHGQLLHLGDEIVDELKRTQDALAALQRKLEALPAAPDKR